MRIAQVAPLYESIPPKLYGGTERIVHYLTEALVAEGHEVTLFASGDSNTSAELIPVCPQSLRLDSQCVDPIAYQILALEQVSQMAPEFDLIHYHCDYFHFPLSRRNPTPQVTTLHGRLDLPDLQPLYREFRDMPLISISDHQREPIRWAYWHGTIYHGLPVDLYRPDPSGGDYLAFLGRISPEKGIEDAVEIALRAGRKLVVAAKVDKVDLEYYQSKIKPLFKASGVEFIGEIDEVAKQDFLGRAHVLLFPIQWPEPFGLVMIEAMACGTPVIAYRQGSVPEVLETGLTGYIADDFEEAAEAVEMVTDLDRTRIRDVFDQRFQASRMAGDYLEIYRTLIRQRARTRHKVMPLASPIEGAPKVIQAR